MSDMPTSLIQLFQMYHRQLGFGVIAALLAVLRHKHNGETIGKYAFDAAVCAFLAGGIDTLLDFFSLPQKWAYLSAVFIGVFGWRVVINLIKSKAPSIGGNNEINR